MKRIGVLGVTGQDRVVNGRGRFEVARLVEA
jgi:hypothetical protein